MPSLQQLCEEVMVIRQSTTSLPAGGFVARGPALRSKVQPENEQFQTRLIELLGERPWFGYRRLHVLIRREGVQANHVG